MPRHRRNSNKEITDRDVQDAVSVIERHYYQEVQEMADTILKEAKQDDLDEEGLRELIERDCDDCQRVIYTFKAQCGMLVTKHADAWEDFGFENPTVEQRMYCALVEDVSEAIDDLGGLDSDDDED